MARRGHAVAAPACNRLDRRGEWPVAATRWLHPACNRLDRRANGPSRPLGGCTGVQPARQASEWPVAATRWLDRRATGSTGERMARRRLLLPRPACYRLARRATGPSRALHDGVPCHCTARRSPLPRRPQGGRPSLVEAAPRGRTRCADLPRLFLGDRRTAPFRPFPGQSSLFRRHRLRSGPPHERPPLPPRPGSPSPATHGGFALKEGPSSATSSGALGGGPRQGHPLDRGVRLPRLRPRRGRGRRAGRGVARHHRRRRRHRLRDGGQQDPRRARGDGLRRRDGEERARAQRRQRHHARRRLPERGAGPQDR